MAGEGLFFTGTVLKNNRNLLEEEAARQQLEMQREELELRKQAAADKRKEDRKKNDYKSKDYTPDGLNPFFIDNVVSKTSEYKKYVDENSQEYHNNPLIRSNIVDMEGGLTGYISKAKNISSILTSYDNLVKQGKGDSLAVSEDGSYLYEYNFNKIQEATSGEKAISLDEALELYPLDSSTTVNKTPYKNPINALYDAKKMTTITNADGSQYKALGDISKESEKVVAGLTPDKNGDWDNKNMEKLYLGKEGIIEVDDEGNKENMSFPAAFAFETRGIDIAGSTTFTDKLNPKNPDTYDPELANEYIQFIKNKSEEKAKRNNPNQSIKAKQDDTNDFQKNINKGKLVSVNDWNTMMNSDKETDYTYGKHGKMLQEVKVAQKSSTHELTSSMLENLEVSNRPVNSKGLTFDTEAVKDYLSKIEGTKEAKLSQVLINSSHDNMYAIYEIEIPADVTQQGATKVEISIPLNQIDKALYGETTEAWYESFKNKDLYNQQEESSSQNKGVGSKYNKNT